MMAAPFPALEQGAKYLLLRILLWLSGRNASPELPAPAVLRRVLILRPDRLGDFLLAMPALQTLINRLSPLAQVTLLVGGRAEQVARAGFPRATVVAYRKLVFSWIHVVGHLLTHSYDVVVDLHSYPFSMTSALMTLAAGGRARIGYRGGPEAEIAAEIFSHGPTVLPEDLHERDRNFLFLLPLGIRATAAEKSSWPEIPVPAKVERAVAQFFAEHKIQADDFVVGIHPTLVKEDNRWSQENYYRLLQRLAKRGKIKILVLWGQGEDREREAFARRLNGSLPVSVLPSCDLLFLRAVARRLRVAVCNDSGLMHWLSLTTDLIVIWGPSLAARWAPRGLQRNVLLQPPDRRCDSVPVSRVLAALKPYESKRTAPRRSGRSRPNPRER